MAVINSKRPIIHFTPSRGWSNDPNGLVYIDGVYHMFYQHFPNATHWGPMHWGHAVSKDLLHWEELPIAIYPDELGLIFSGSCFYDTENKSGFATKDIPFLDVKGQKPLIAIYTSHYVDPEKGMQYDIEQQSIAYSTDLVHFEKYYGNPVIPNNGNHDFRDPKVFWNEMHNCFTMAVGGPYVSFYKSQDLKHWEKTGEFHMPSFAIPGVCECPDCFPLTADDGTERWVLTMSVIVDKDYRYQNNDMYDRSSNISQYFVGTFDGDKFVCTEEYDHPLLLDYGTDQYAAVTYQNTEEKILVGWSTNLEYAMDLVMKDGYNGRMTLPRKLGLKKTAEGYRLTNSFEAIEPYKVHATALATGDNALHMETFGLRVVSGKTGSIILKNTLGEKLVIALTGDEVIVDRSQAGVKDFHEAFAKESLSVNHAKRLFPEDGTMDIIWDCGTLEVIADQGIAGFTAFAFPTKMYDCIEVRGDLQAEIYEIK